jgi:hypothetical protein
VLPLSPLGQYCLALPRAWNVAPAVAFEYWLTYDSPYDPESASTDAPTRLISRKMISSEQLMVSELPC